MKKLSIFLFCLAASLGLCAQNPVLDLRPDKTVFFYADGAQYKGGLAADFVVAKTRENAGFKMAYTNGVTGPEIIEQSGSLGNVSDFAYEYGFSQGGVVQAIIPLQGVQEFSTVGIRIDGEDEWQIGGLTIAKVKSYEGRVAAWKEIQSTEKDLNGNSRLQSHLLYTREVEAEKPCYTLGNAPKPGEDPVDPKDDDWVPGTLIQDDDNWTVIDGRGGNVMEKDEIDWNTLLHYMTYEDTQLELGFTKQRCLYKVKVEVAGDKVNADDDDCGSANLLCYSLPFLFFLFFFSSSLFFF